MSSAVERVGSSMSRGIERASSPISMSRSMAAKVRVQGRVCSCGGKAAMPAREVGEERVVEFVG